METNHYLQRIRDEFPKLKWTKHQRYQTIPVEPDHVMILLDGKIAFRFEEGCDEGNLVKERAVLNALRSRTKSIPSPEFTFLPKSPDFVGYKAIQGTRLSPWRFERLSKSNRADAAKRLGAFINGLHSYPVAKARKLGVGEGNSSVWKRQRGKDILAERGGELQPKVRKIFERWIERSDSVDHSFKPVLAQNDLWYKHIYHDPSTGKLSGIIDWGDIEITDPAKDFYGFWGYGESFLDEVLSHYDYADPNIKERSFEHFWGIAIGSWFSRPPGGRFFRRSTWAGRPTTEWPMLQVR
jgi:aminoglycoside 2''-phosphotransferase